MQDLQPQIEALREKAQLRGSKGLGESLSQTWGLYRKNNINPHKSWIMALVQLPLFILFFVALRNLCMRPEYTVELSTGGALWFKDLTSFDPYWALPILCGVGAVTMLEFQYRIMPTPPGVILKWGGRFFAFFIVWITTSLPMGVNVYFLTSSVMGCISFAIFQIHAFRRLVGLRPLGKTVTPPRVVSIDHNSHTANIQQVAKELAKGGLGKKKKR